MALADGAALPTSVSIADGPKHDVSLVDEALDAVWVDGLSPVLIADKGKGSGRLADSLRAERNIDLRGSSSFAVSSCAGSARRATTSAFSSSDAWSFC